MHHTQEKKGREDSVVKGESGAQGKVAGEQQENRAAQADIMDEG